MIGDLGTGSWRDRIQALLFGAAGLIPKLNSLKEKGSRDYVRQIAREWKVMKSHFTPNPSPCRLAIFPNPTIQLSDSSNGCCLCTHQQVFFDIFSDASSKQ